MQSRLFSVFMTLTICPPLIQQLQPRYLHFRGMYESREANSKIYNWSAFVTSSILPELPYSIIAGSIYFNCWFVPPPLLPPLTSKTKKHPPTNTPSRYWGIWFPRDSFSSGYTWMLLMLFELFYVSFGQFIAAISPNELLASLLVPCFFTFIVAFCGVVVPYMALPHFWQSWMYWLTPFHYLLEGFLGVVVHEVPMECIQREEAFFTVPPGFSTCQEYAGRFASQATGYIRDAGGGLCAYCLFSTGDEFVCFFPSFPCLLYLVFFLYLSLPILPVLSLLPSESLVLRRITHMVLSRQRTSTSTIATSGATTASSGRFACSISRLFMGSRGFICMALMMRRGGFLRGKRGRMFRVHEHGVMKGKSNLMPSSHSPLILVLMSLLLCIQEFMD